MKRAFTIMLMTAVLLLSLSAPAAGELIEYDYPRNTVPLWNADENWGDRYTLDTQNQTEGEGCISINLNSVTGTHAPFKVLETVDATGMLALEFDMYISDLAVLDHLQSVTSGSIEICSGGKCDEGEKNYDLAVIARDVQQGCPKIGWNHVIIFLNKMADTEGSYGPFDIGHINYLRIYWTGMTDCGQDWVLKFDNFVLTDREVEPGVPHTPGEWQYDEEKHRRYCVYCGELLGEALHCPEGGCESTGSCKACGLECGPYEHEYALTTPTHLYLASDPTCTEEARIYYCCVRCRERSEETFEFGESLGHDLTEGYVSCEADGHSMKCRRCEEYVNVIPHTFGEWETVREATEGESGLKQRSCAECTYVETQEIVYVAPEPQTPQTPAVPVAPSDDGCSAVLVSGAPAMLVLIAAAGWMVRKKKK